VARSAPERLNVGRPDTGGARDGRFSSLWVPVAWTEQFLSDDRDILGCFDSKPDPVAADSQDRDSDIVADGDRLVDLAV
jgi:hypothetical protein